MLLKALRLTLLNNYDIIYIENKKYNLEEKKEKEFNDMRTGSYIIGKYQGKEVYKVTLSEYVNNRYYKDKYYVFLIDGELIYNNEAFASYDGNYVNIYDPHKKRTFYNIPTFTESGGIGKEGYDTANGNFKSKDSKENSSTSGNETKTETEPSKGVEETLAGVYETDYFSDMIDIDAFLKANSEF